MKKIVSIVGARPNIIKLAVLAPNLEQVFDHKILHTGQHYDYRMDKIFFDELDVPEPDANLGIGSGTHAHQTGTMMIGIEKYLDKEKPDAIIVYGDTNTTLAGALASSKLHIPVAHAEAGLRSFDNRMPEEMNRKLTDHVSDFLFCPTNSAVVNLAKEGITDGVYRTGDLNYDLYHQCLNLTSTDICNKFGLKMMEPFYFATIHRAENTDNMRALKYIITGLIRLTRKDPSDTFVDHPKKVIFPIHPRTKMAIQRLGIDIENITPDLRVIEPISYIDTMSALRFASAVITDSGGLQKEAYMSKVPCITLRRSTEWMETVDLGWNHLVDPSRNNRADLIIAHTVFSEMEPDAQRIRNRHYDGKLFASYNSAASIMTEILIREI